MEQKNGLKIQATVMGVSGRLIAAKQEQIENQEKNKIIFEYN